MVMFVSRGLVVVCGFAVYSFLFAFGVHIDKGAGEYWGDFLGSIVLKTDQGWKDIARRNDLDNPNLIEVGKVLRVVPPLPVAPAPDSPAPDSGVVTRPVTSSTVVPTTPAMAPA